MNPHIATWSRFLSDCGRVAAAATPYQVSGRLTRINGLVLEATGLKLPLGSGCRIVVPMGSAVEAEVVGFSGDKLFMMPTDDIFGVAPGAQVFPLEALPQAPQAGERFEPRRRATDRAKHVPVGEALLGRVVDGSGRPLDGGGPLKTAVPVSSLAPHQPVAARTDRSHAGCRGARDQRAAHRRAAASAWACSPARAWARACSWA